MGRANQQFGRVVTVSSIIDRNHDSTISSHEWKEAFNVLDENRDGVISRKEWYAKNGDTALYDAIKRNHRQKASITRIEWERAFNDLDANHDSQVTMQEVKSLALVMENRDKAKQCIEDDREHLWQDKRAKLKQADVQFNLLMQGPLHLRRNGQVPGDADVIGALKDVQKAYRQAGAKADECKVLLEILREYLANKDLMNAKRTNVEILNTVRCKRDVAAAKVKIAKIFFVEMYVKEAFQYMEAAQQLYGECGDEEGSLETFKYLMEWQQTSEVVAGRQRLHNSMEKQSQIIMQRRQQKNKEADIAYASIWNDSSVEVCGDIVKALRKVCMMYQEAGAKKGMIMVLSDILMAHAANHEKQQCDRVKEEILALASNKNETAQLKADIGKLMISKRHLKEAEKNLQESWNLCLEIGDKDGEAEVGHALLAFRNSVAAEGLKSTSI